MFSAAAGSLFLSFLPMLPTQILLNNLLYDLSEMTIPADNVDEEQLRRPSHCDTAQIRRFMLFFGPISSLFDFATFAILLLGLHAGPILFRSGWFVGSLATQSLAIFAIRPGGCPSSGAAPAPRCSCRLSRSSPSGCGYPSRRWPAPSASRGCRRSSSWRSPSSSPPTCCCWNSASSCSTGARPLGPPRPRRQRRALLAPPDPSPGVPTARCARLARHRRDRSRAPSPASS
ncbi:MAG: cation transporting ATPase C-terminal domain-containing protein [Kineosporiaceae bacterium]